MAMIDYSILILTFMARIVDHRWVYIDEKMMNMTIMMMTILTIIMIITLMTMIILPIMMMIPDG